MKVKQMDEQTTELISQMMRLIVASSSYNSMKKSTCKEDIVAGRQMETDNILGELTVSSKNSLVCCLELRHLFFFHCVRSPATG